MSSNYRKTIIVNLDPGNDNITYECSINIDDLITLEDVQTEFKLGPNGAMMYCMEYLEKNISWLIEELKTYKDSYLLFDFPGQVELFTHHKSVRNIIKILENHNHRLTCIHLVDSSYCIDATKYISVLMTSLTTMMMLELPQINVFSKIDLLQNLGKLDFNLEYYTQVMDLSYLLYHLNQSSTEKYYKLNGALCELIEEFNLVGFQTLCITDKHSVFNLLKEIDKANGYIFGGLTAGNESIFMAANATDLLSETREAQEKYFSGGTDADTQKNETDDRKTLKNLISSLETDNIEIHEEF
ncbi:hypothetical protein BB560_004360 [Smittium megazygosporum]|uniref:GPN-loop GTPase 2 n=1 Tax=Smittium megazygosporum TaxID=133381 RepID=A0A2T9Z9G0_9FUNG|nr:hypothetical protein BB560_004360 [Smittium megazygosporum]